MALAAASLAPHAARSPLRSLANFRATGGLHGGAIIRIKKLASRRIHFQNPQTRSRRDAGKRVCPRSANDEPCCPNLAVVGAFRTLKHKSTLASAPSSAESLFAHEAGGSIVVQCLQNMNR